MMYACTFVAVFGYVYELFNGRFRWSIRSSPHDGTGDWVASMLTNPSCSTKSTPGSAASREAAASLSETENPRRAAE